MLWEGKEEEQIRHVGRATTLWCLLTPKWTLT